MNWEDAQGKIIWVALLVMVGSTIYMGRALNRIPTREEVAQMIRTDTPYARDKGLIDEKMRLREQAEARILQKLDALTSEIVRINALMLCEKPGKLLY